MGQPRSTRGIVLRPRERWYRVDVSTPQEDVDAATWWVYVLVASGAPRTYVGIARDVERRLSQHNGELPGGAKSTRAGRPWRVGRIVGPFEERGSALVEEARLKRRRGLARLEHEVAR